MKNPLADQVIDAQAIKMKFGDAVAERMTDELTQYAIAKDVVTCFDLKEDYANSDLTVFEIMEKIRDFVNSDHGDIDTQIFLLLLAAFPISMCKREVTSNLKALIGFHYHYGQRPYKWNENTIWDSKISMDTLSIYYGRSKATIHEYAEEFRDKWKEAEVILDNGIGERDKARQDAYDKMVAEELEKLKAERLNSRLNERTAT